MAPAKASQVTTRRLADAERRARPVGAADKLDFTVAEGALYATPPGFVVVTTDARTFLSISAAGNPRTSTDYASALDALHAAAYAVKVRNKALARRGAPGADDAVRRDFRVPPLERVRGDVAVDTVDGARWTLLYRIPNWIDDIEVADVLDELEIDKRLPALARIRRLRQAPGSWLQTGFDGDWRPALKSVTDAFEARLREHGTVVDARWHEVRLGDAGTRAVGYLVRRRIVI